MTTIQRDDFVRRLSDRGGYIHVDRIPADVQRTLSAAGIRPEDLREIAGQDHVIRGRTEFENLFRLIDRRADHDGRSSTIRTTGTDGTPTPSGRVAEALERLVDSNRARAMREGGARFSGSSGLDDVYAGRRVLNAGDRGDDVRRVQQALVDMGYANTALITMGTFDAETRRAVERFQRDAHIRIDGKVGRETLGALAATAPPPGQVLERSADYGRLCADGRLDVTIALGFDEGWRRPDGTMAPGAHIDAERDVLSGLRARGFRALSATDISRMSSTDRTRLGLTADRVDPNARFFVRDDGAGGNVDTVVRLVTPGTDGRAARASFMQAMQQDEVVIYSGHARYGTGPDFDRIDRGRGNFVIDGHGNRDHHGPPADLRGSIGRSSRSDLRDLSGRPDYQLLIFNACSTEEYLHNLRDPSVFRRDMANTDIITSTIPTRLATNAQHTLRFLDGVMGREANRSMLSAQSDLEVRALRGFGMTSEIPGATRTYSESGFLDNPGTRAVRTGTGARP